MSRHSNKNQRGSKMAKSSQATAGTASKQNVSKKETQPMFSWPFGPLNVIVLAVAIAFLIAGYAFLSVEPHDSFQSLSVAPVLLVLGYLVLVPAAILVPGKLKKDKKSE